MEVLAESRAVQPLVERGLADADPRLRAQAVALLGSLGEPALAARLFATVSLALETYPERAAAVQPPLTAAPPLQRVGRLVHRAPLITNAALTAAWAPRC